MMIVRCACGAFVLLKREPPKGRAVYFECCVCHTRGEATEVRSWPAIVPLNIEPIRLEREVSP